MEVDAVFVFALNFRISFSVFDIMLPKVNYSLAKCCLRKMGGWRVDVSSEFSFFSKTNF